MTQSTSRPGGPPLPKWFVGAGSLLILYHFCSVVLNALAAPSGPWPGRNGEEMAMPPHALAMMHEQSALPYLRVIKMTHNYHFRSNRVARFEAYLEVKLFDKEGQLIKTVRLPDVRASRALRQKQDALARWLPDDMPVPPTVIERIAAPGARAAEISVWRGGSNPNELSLTPIKENEVPNNEVVLRPSDWSLIVVRSIARHLCRVHDAEWAEPVRYSREAIPAGILFEPETPPNPEILQSAYGRISR